MTKSPESPQPSPPSADVTPGPAAAGPGRFGSPLVPFLGVLLALLPVVRTGSLVAQYFVPVPLVDQWWLVPTLDSLFDGTPLTWKEISTHNEHMMLFPKLIMIGLASVTRWNLYYELAVNFGIMMAATAAAAAALRRSFRFSGHLPSPWLYFALSLALWSAAAFENWLWTWQMTIFTVLLCLTAGSWLLLRLVQEPHAGWRSFFAAAALAGVASFSFASGLMVWGSGALFLALLHGLSTRGGIADRQSPEQKGFRPSLPRFLAVWTLLAAACAGLYLLGYERPRWSDPGEAILSHPGRTFVYGLATLGSPLADRREPDMSVLFGGWGIVAWVIGAVAAMKAGRRHALAAALPFCWGAFSIMCAGLISAGRANFTTLEQAMAPRYTSLTVFLWFSAVSLFCIAAQAEKEQKKLRSASVRYCVAVLITALLAYSSYRGESELRRFGDYVWDASWELVGSMQNAVLLKHLHPEPARIREEWLPVLRQHQLGIFQYEENAR